MKELSGMIFWGSLLLILYAYFGYPLILKIISSVRSLPVRKGDIRPNVSYIVTAYNEVDKIGSKIENVLELDYPRESLEIIVASDCSDDGTDDVAKTFADRGVKLVRLQYHGGKEAAQKAAIEASGGEIIVFSDVATRNDPEALKKIVRNFNDPTVGCVSSEDRVLDDGDNKQGESAYVKYEMMLRRLESRAKTVVGLSGSFFAARREVCRDWAADLASDFNTLLNSIKQDMRGISDPEVIGYYRNIKSSKGEMKRKVRTVLRGITVFMASIELLNPLKYGLFAWQLFSHKLCRWLVPFALIALLSASAALQSVAPIYRAALAGQSLFYLMVLCGFLFPKSEKLAFFRIPKYFFAVNLSILIAWIKFISGRRLVRWEPSER